uniref:Uncharacterized protein n=1 Tax=Strigamia maritima TaxID=126957 RepID=T1J054_STRMM
MATAELENKILTSSREDLTKAKIEKILSMCDTTAYDECAGATAGEGHDGEMTSQERLECSLVRNYGSEDLFSLKNFKSGEIETVSMEKNTAPEDVLKESVKKIQEECSKKKNVKGKPSKIIKDKGASVSPRKDMSDVIDPKDIIDMCPFYGLENSEAAVDDRFHHKNTASMTNFFILNDLNISDVVWTYDEYMGKKPAPCPVSRRTSFWQRLRNHLKFSSHSRPMIRPVVSRIQKNSAVKPTQ